MARALGRLRRREILAAAAGLMAVAPAAWPAFGKSPDRDAERVVQDLVEDIWATLRRDGVDGKQRLDELTALLEARTDVALISRLALGRYWGRLPASERQTYQGLFRDVVIRSMARRLDTYAEDAKAPLSERFRILSSAPVGERDVLVRSKVFPTEGQPLDIDWRLRTDGSAPVIIDLIIEGASLLVSQRSEFAAVIERGDLAGLLNELRARAASPT
jgi:phospholipid transport system substrate-binding protein